MKKSYVTSILTVSNVNVFFLFQMKECDWFLLTHPHVANELLFFPQVTKEENQSRFLPPDGICKPCPIGDQCEGMCGERCSFGIPMFGEFPYCDPVDGHCLCKSGRDPLKDCKDVCASGTFYIHGKTKKCEPCECANGKLCDPTTGVCK